jgi:uncharacterized SAM-binding protein YcdF (DUF218 family)
MTQSGFTRRWTTAVVALLFVTTFAVLSFIGLGRWVSAGASVPERADLLVALGGDDGARVQKVAALVKGGYAPIVLITGLDGSPADTRRHYLEWRARVLIEAGVPADRLVFEGTAYNSYQEAVATLALMRARGWKTALVVSDPPHMRRLNWVWGRVFAGSGLSYRLVVGAPVWWDADRWWRNERSGQFVLTEVIKLGYYLVSY